MSLRFIDSIVPYNGSGIVEKWTSANNDSYTSTGGRRNGAFISLAGGSVAKTLTHQAAYIQGVAIKYNPGNGASLAVFNNNSAIVELLVNSDSTVSAFTPQNGLRLATSALAVADSTSWHYYELSCTVSGGTGAVTATGTIKVDGVQFLTFNGTTGISGSQLIDGSATINQVGLVTGGTLSFMDYYCIDTSGTDLNGGTSTLTAFLGDVQIDAIFPAGDVTTQWGSSGGDGTHAYTSVNANPINYGTDTAYVSTTNTASNNVEKFTYQPISGFTGTILGAQYSVLARKDAEGVRIINMTVGTHTTTTIEFQGTSNYLSDYYVYYISPLDTDFGTVWTTAAFGTGGTETFGFQCIG